MGIILLASLGFALGCWGEKEILDNLLDKSTLSLM